ncbi:hypothetical protein E2C01_016168 [Portunus trituberculatus]|uniref:Secreted protein n=1 Tax=Portunus trituberculatus TaxID=210409 RepID=A0A5B7DPW7_PORTR|nr:hypothetical protein [Portunus trituberculatus]
MDWCPRPCVPVASLTLYKTLAVTTTTTTTTSTTPPGHRHHYHHSRPFQYIIPQRITKKHTSLSVLGSRIPYSSPGMPTLRPLS